MDFFHSQKRVDVHFLHLFSHFFLCSIDLPPVLEDFEKREEINVDEEASQNGAADSADDECDDDDEMEKETAGTFG